MVPEKYIKAGIITGIVLVSLTFVFSVIPFLITIGPQTSWAFTSNESIEKTFKQTEEYIVFTERFPNYKEKFIRNYDSAVLSVFANSDDLENLLRLDLSTYGFSMNNLQINAQCQATHIKSGTRYNADSFLVKPFLETTNCLEP